MVKADITVIGAGPAGLFFARMARLAVPASQVHVLERDGPEDAYGFGVSLSSRTLSELARHDPPTHDRIIAASTAVTGLEVRLPAGSQRYDGFGFAAVSRAALLRILREQAIEAGATIAFHHDAAPGATGAGTGPRIVAVADGAASAHRESRRQAYGTSTITGSARFIWLGTDAVLGDAATFIFVPTEFGPMAAHVYPYGAGLSTVVVETDSQTWHNAGFAADDPGPVSDQSLTRLSAIFAEHLQGRPLVSNRSRWSRFTTVRNARWSHGNTVLLGDAAHTAHFTVASGTKMALEDGLALATALGAADCLADAFAAYEQSRRESVARTQRLAESSLGWWETYLTRLHQPPAQFGLHFLTRTGALSYLTLRAQCAPQVKLAEASFSGAIGPAANAISTPVTIGQTRLPSRLAVVAPGSTPGVVWLTSTEPHQDRLEFADLTCPPEPEWTPAADELVHQAAKLRDRGANGVLLRGNDWFQLLRHASRLRFEAELAVAVLVPADWALDLMTDPKIDNWPTRIHVALITGRIDLAVPWPG